MLKRVLSKLGWRERTVYRNFMLDHFPKNSRGIEIGVHFGDFSAELLGQLQPTELVLIDPWHHEDSETYKEAWFGGKGEGGQAEMDKRFNRVSRRFKQLTRQGVVCIERGFSNDILPKLEPDHYDWVYIDGNHLYDFVKQDIEMSLPLIKKGGLIAGDDYSVAGWWDDGVTKAVDEFAQQDELELILLEQNQFVFRKL